MAKVYTYIPPKSKNSDLVVDSSNLVTKTELRNKIQEVKSYTDIEIDKILDGVSDKFDTLKELADAINNDPNFYLNISNKIDSVIDKSIDNILSCDFNINPKRYKNVNISCKFCKYKDICYMSNEDIVDIKEEVDA